MEQTTEITSQTSKEHLPDDTDTLKEMVLTLLGRIDDIEGQLLYLKRQLFGKKSEKLNPQQRLLFENLYNEVQAKVEEKRQTKNTKKSRANANHKGRKPLPEDLPRQEIEIEPDEAEKICSVCSSDKERIGEQVTEKLEYVPASFKVKKYIRHKYACKQCQGNISIGSLPVMAIDKGIAGEGLLAHIITSKYADHAPLNRLEGILKRHGVDITVSNMCDWVAKCAYLLEPLVKRMHHHIRLSPKINTDDTKIPIKSKNRKGSTHNGYLWTYIDDKFNAVFDFTPNRSRQGPIDFIGKKYTGYVQADAYSGYDELFEKTPATEVGCYAHARRKFEHAMDSDPVRAARMMALWAKLYEIESRAKKEKFSKAQLLQVRQEESKAILEQIREAIYEYKDQVLPKGPIAKAINYTLNQWDALMQYIENPILDIDNNLSERTLRMVVIGRKNYMFAGSEAGAERAAIIYSLVASCKLNGHDPFVYFNDVLRKVSTHRADKIDELLPSNWKPPESKPEDTSVIDEQIIKVA